MKNNEVSWVAWGRSGNDFVKNIRAIRLWNESKAVMILNGTKDNGQLFDVCVVGPPGTYVPLKYQPTRSIPFSFLIEPMYVFNLNIEVASEIVPDDEKESFIRGWLDENNKIILESIGYGIIK